MSICTDTSLSYAGWRNRHPTGAGILESVPAAIFAALFLALEVAERNPADVRYDAISTAILWYGVFCGLAYLAHAVMLKSCGRRNGRPSGRGRAL